MEQDATILEQMLGYFHVTPTGFADRAVAPSTTPAGDEAVIL